MTKKYSHQEKLAMKDMCENRMDRFLRKCTGNWEPLSLHNFECTKDLAQLVNCEKYARSRVRYNPELYNPKACKPTSTIPAETHKYD